MEEKIKIRRKCTKNIDLDPFGPAMTNKRLAERKRNDRQEKQLEAKKRRLKNIENKIEKKRLAFERQQAFEKTDITFEEIPENKEKEIV